MASIRSRRPARKQGHRAGRPAHGRRPVGAPPPPPIRRRRRHQLLRRDATSCRRVRPGIVHCWLPGFAEADDEAPAPAWEAVILASSGVFRDMGLNRRLLGVAASYSPLPLASAYASVLAALAVCAALYRDAARGVGVGEGEGDAITVPLASALCETLCHNSLELQSLPTRTSTRGAARRADGPPAAGDGARTRRPCRSSSTRLPLPRRAPFYLVAPSHLTIGDAPSLCSASPTRSPRSACPSPAARARRTASARARWATRTRRRCPPRAFLTRRADGGRSCCAGVPGAHDRRVADLAACARGGAGGGGGGGRRRAPRPRRVVLRPAR